MKKTAQNTKALQQRNLLVITSCLLGIGVLLLVTQRPSFLPFGPQTTLLAQTQESEELQSPWPNKTYSSPAMGLSFSYSGYSEPTEEVPVTAQSSRVAHDQGTWVSVGSGEAYTYIYRYNNLSLDQAVQMLQAKNQKQIPLTRQYFKDVLEYDRQHPADESEKKYRMARITQVTESLQDLENKVRSGYFTFQPLEFVDTSGDTFIARQGITLSDASDMYSGSLEMSELLVQAGNDVLHVVYYAPSEQSSLIPQTLDIH